jgi:hypothetical protein
MLYLASTHDESLACCEQIAKVYSRLDSHSSCHFTVNNSQFHLIHSGILPIPGANKYLPPVARSSPR